MLQPILHRRRLAAAALLMGAVCFAIVAMPARADELTRRAQEELRRRHLYFGDIDGKRSAAFADVLRRYQERKGFDESGRVDSETAASLNILDAFTQAGGEVKNSWPDVPVLKSDTAPVQPKLDDKVTLVSAGETSAAAQPPVPAEAPSESNEFTREEIQQLVESYLRDAEGDDVEAQVKYYEFPVDYFDHGALDRAAVWQDTRNYVKRWPGRKYLLTDNVMLRGGKHADEAVVQFDIAFTVKNVKHTVNGRTRNFWTIGRQANGQLKINAIREERLHP